MLINFITCHDFKNTNNLKIEKELHKLIKNLYNNNNKNNNNNNNNDNNNNGKSKEKQGSNKINDENNNNDDENIIDDEIPSIGGSVGSSMKTSCPNG